MSENQNKKRERGANYTPEEKALMADLIKQYKHIIENKRTGTTFINKKKQAWIEITRKYNSNSTTGNRGAEQLKALYDNMKQKARKYVGESNKTEYIKTLTILAQTQLLQENVVTEADLKKALENVKEDKVQMNKTGGGFWKPKVTDSDAKILAIIKDQVEPLSNPYDSGAVYFKDDSQPEQCPSPAPSTENIMPNTSFDSPKHGMDAKKIGQDNSENCVVTIPSRAQRQRKIRKMNEVPTVQKKLKKTTSVAAFKRTYFKLKCQNACLERKKIMQDILHSKLEHQRQQQQHNLKMLILQKKLNT